MKDQPRVFCCFLVSLLRLRDPCELDVLISGFVETGNKSGDQLCSLRYRQHHGRFFDLVQL